MPATVSCEVSVQQNSEPPAVTQTNNTKPSAKSVEVDAKQDSAVVVSLEVSPEKEIPAESSTPAKGEKPAQPTNFFKMFKKKNEPVPPAAEVSCEVSVQQNNEPPAVTQTDNAKPSAESVEVDAKQVSAVVVSLEVAPEQEIPAESSTPAKDETPKPAQPTSFFKLFKKKTEPIVPVSEVSCEVSVQQNSEPLAVTQAKNTKPSVEVDAKQDSAVVISLEVAPEQEIPAESSTPAKEETPKPAQPTSFFKMFKKKNEPIAPAAEVSCEVSVQQNSEPRLVTQTNNTKPPAESVEVDVKQDSAVVVSLEVSPEQEIPAESSTPAKDETPKPAQPTNFFKLFKKKNEPVAPAAEVSCEVSVQQNGEPFAVTQTDNIKPSVETVEVDAEQDSAVVVSLEVAPEQVIPVEISIPAKETPKPAPKAKFFKMFQKKNEPITPAVSENKESAEEQTAPEVQIDGQMTEPPDIKGSTQPEEEPQGETLNSSATEVAEDIAQPEEVSPEENPVMNFFKTLVSPTKTTKEATAAPDASKDQSQKEAPSASVPNVQEVPKVPPPPPPAPPKMENKAESAVKKEEAPAAAAAAAAKEQETPSKAKAKDSPFGKLFRPKALLGKVVSKVQAATVSGASAPAKTSAASVVKEEAEPVEVQVDASKTSTLEAAAKPEPPPAPKPEEKKAEKKPSPFANLLKPKVLLGQVSSKIQAAASSAAASVSLGTGGAATEHKKEPPAAPAAAEAAASVKVKEEPKPAVTATAAAASAPDNKSVGSADNPSPSVPRKLEKRNSIQLFFKNLGQKRHSDAGVQTEAVAPEKAK
ncbi:hypothetical protein AOLI_G00157500 [Acnodon oligacanthus]